MLARVQPHIFVALAFYCKRSLPRISMAHKVLATRILPPQGQRVLEDAVSSGSIELIQWDSQGSAERSWLIAHLQAHKVEALVCMLGDRIDEEALEAAGPSLKIVSTMSAGYDHIDISALKQRGIRLGTTPDALTDATADIGAMLTLMASRNAGEGIRAVAEGKWPSMPWEPLLLCGYGLQKRTVGILGFGKIGQLTLKRLVGFGIGRAIYTTSKLGETLPAEKDFFNLLRNPEIPISPATSMKQLAQESDFLLITCSLNSKTHHSISTEFLAEMKPTAYIINTARGAVIDSAALVSAIQRGNLAGAGLDVVEGEPNIGAEHELVKEKKIVVLPHIGSATFETRGEMARQAAVNCLAGLNVKDFQWENEVKF